MPTESSGVSDLLHQMQTRRLRTDPGDAWLFDAATSQPARRHVPLIVAPAPAPAPSRAPAQRVAPVRRASPAAARDRVWPWILATLVVAGLSAAGAAHVWNEWLEDDLAATVVSTPEPVQVTAVAAAPVAAAPVATEDPALLVPIIAIEPASRELLERVTATRNERVVKPRKPKRAQAPPAKRVEVPAKRVDAPARPAPAAPVRASRQNADSENPL